MCLSSVNWRDQFANVCNFYFKPEADWYEFETTLFFGKACMLNFNSKVRRHWLQGAWVKFERKKKVLSYSHKITTNHFPRRACTCSPTLLGQHIFLRPVSNCDQFTDQRVDVPIHARTAHDGQQQIRPEQDFCWIIPPSPQWRNQSRDWTALNFWSILIHSRLWHHCWKHDNPSTVVC